jgi:serine/threonine protein kinase
MSECPDVDVLRRLEAGELSDDEADSLWSHVEECSSCGDSLERFRRENLDGRVIRAALGGDTTLTATPGAAAVEPSKAPLWAIPDYERVRLCGEGAYGTVWAVRDRVGVHRALKAIDLGRLQEANVQCRESTALEAYCRHVEDHPNLIRIFHVGMQASLLYYTMELADDEVTRKPVRETFPSHYRPLTLQRVMEHGRIRGNTAIEVVIRLLRGLSRLHAAGIAHRDIKPANIVFVGRVPKLADIGMITTNTESPSRVGTPEFMPPDGKMDLTGDVYALGRILFELLSGLESGEFPRVRPDLFDAGDQWNCEKLNQVLAKACATDAKDRYRNAAEMLEALEECRELLGESLFAELEQSLASSHGVKSAPSAAPIIIAAIHAVPWILGLLLLIVLVQKLL